MRKRVRREKRKEKERKKRKEKKRKEKKRKRKKKKEKEKRKKKKKKESAAKYDQLTKAVRAHGNFIEQVIPNVILVALLELNGEQSPNTIHGLLATLLASRILHSEFGINGPNGLSNGRPLGTFMSYIVTIIASSLHIYTNSKLLF